MKKSLVVVIAVSVFVLLYFLTGQQKSNIDQQVNVLNLDADQPIKKIPDENELSEDNLSELDSSKTHFLDKNLEAVMDESVRQAVNKIVNTSSEGLIEVQTKDGVVVDLEGRFQSVPVAVIGKDGEVTIKDYTSKIPDKK